MFEIKCDFKIGNIRTLTEYGYYKIPSWQSSNSFIESIPLGGERSFKIKCNPDVIPEEISESKRAILFGSLNEETLIIKHPISPDKNYYRLYFSSLSRSALSELFFSTRVFKEIGGGRKELPDNIVEYIVFCFNPEEGIAVIKEICVYSPNPNETIYPFYKYLRDSFIPPIRKFNVDTNEKIGGLDFYNYHSNWLKRNQIDDVNDKIIDQPGIYMLLDTADKKLYIGKANNIRSRLKGHRDSPNDINRNFDYFRYSTINIDYLQLLYVIEASAIHDFSCLFKMPRSRKGKNPLIDFLKTNCPDAINLNEYTLSNKIDAQLRRN